MDTATNFSMILEISKTYIDFRKLRTMMVLFRRAVINKWLKPIKSEDG